jgi:hypothetical protein
VRTHLAFGQQERFETQLRQVQAKFGIPALEEELGGPVDVAAADTLYQPPMDHEPVAGSEDFGVHRIRVNGVIIRYEEDLHGIEVTFEGGLPQKVINAVLKDLEAKLTRLERSPCSANRV